MLYDRVSTTYSYLNLFSFLPWHLYLPPLGPLHTSTVSCLPRKFLVIPPSFGPSPVRGDFPLPVCGFTPAVRPLVTSSSLSPKKHSRPQPRAHSLRTIFARRLKAAQPQHHPAATINLSCSNSWRDTTPRS